MTPFKYIIIFIFIILGLGIAVVLTRVAGLIRQWECVSMY